MFTIVVSRLKELEEQGGLVNPENPSEQSGLSACGASIGEIKCRIPEFRVVEFLSGIILRNAAGKDVYGLPIEFAAKPRRAKNVDDVCLKRVAVVDHIFFGRRKSPLGA